VAPTVDYYNANFPSSCVGQMRMVPAMMLLFSHLSIT
jgi:hypothetical protein